MRAEALFINGVYEHVFEEILQIQSALPEQILFLQPYSGKAMTHLRKNPPTVEDPMLLYASITKKLPMVHYTAEIVGWDDKRTLSEKKRRALNQIILKLQPTEGGLYNESRVEAAPSANLLYIRRLRELKQPFSVEKLLKTGDNQPLSSGRTTAGGWVYVRNQTA